MTQPGPSLWFDPATAEPPYPWRHPQWCQHPLWWWWCPWDSAPWAPSCLPLWSHPSSHWLPCGCQEFCGDDPLLRLHAQRGDGWAHSHPLHSCPLQYSSKLQQHSWSRCGRLFPNYSPPEEASAQAGLGLVLKGRMYTISHTQHPCTEWPTLNVATIAGSTTAWPITCILRWGYVYLTAIVKYSLKRCGLWYTTAHHAQALAECHKSQNLAGLRQKLHQYSQSAPSYRMIFFYMLQQMQAQQLPGWSRVFFIYFRFTWLCHCEMAAFQGGDYDSHPTTLHRY